MQNLPKGTPNTLSQAIINGMMNGPMNQLHESVELHVKDFIRNVLCIHFLNYSENPDIMDLLYRLEVQLGCKMSELEVKRIEKNLGAIMDVIEGEKVSGK